MAEEPAAEVQLLRRQKAKLIEILSADADFVLQHADARCLLSLHGYQQVKSCRVPSEKVTDLLDHVIQRGSKAAQGMLDLLKEQDMQETFPKLCFVKHLRVGMLCSEEKEISRKRNAAPESQDLIPSKRICNNSESHSKCLPPHSWTITNNVHCSHCTGRGLVEERQLMTVARAIGRSWREIGRLALDIRSVKLEEIEENHSLHVERVFAMLQHWRARHRDRATAARLHSLLSQDDWALPPESINCLLETD